MKWFWPSYWSSLLMGRPMTQTEKSISVESSHATNTQSGSNKAEMSVGQVAVSTTTTKSKPTASQNSSILRKSQSTSKHVKRKRGRPKKSAR